MCVMTFGTLVVSALQPRQNVMTETEVHKGNILPNAHNNLSMCIESDV